MTSNPHIVGYQSAGEVIAVGSNVKQFAVGDKVVTIGMTGSHAEQRKVSQHTAWKVPAGLDIKKAAAVPIPFGTADECLFEFGKMKAGDSVLVQAASSAVGIAAIQLAKNAGAKVIIGTASSKEKLDKLKALGMTHGIDYTKDDLVNSVMEITGGKGVDVIVDPVGGDAMRKGIQCLAYRGRLSVVGMAGRDGGMADLSSLMLKQLTVCGVFLGAELGTPRVTKMIAKHLDDAAAGKLEVVLDKEFKLSEAAAAHEYIESRKAVGRVLLVV
jgi:NADPH2:quinone reductase